MLFNIEVQYLFVVMILYGVANVQNYNYNK